jgi:fructose-specific phosphotransferase system IIC component
MSPDEYVWELAWRRALGLALLQLLIPVLLGYAGLTIAFFRRRELAPGILCVCCAVLCPGLPVGLLIALAFGWLHAARWGMRPFMALWTVLVAIACLDVVAVAALRDLDGATLQRLFGGQ